MLALRPIKQRAGFAFIREHHRHHKPPRGWLWGHSVQNGEGAIVGVAVVGRPVARPLDDGWTCEVTRLCTIGDRNACSMLYAAARRAADAKGYRRGLTYILASEWDRFEGNRRIGGRSLMAAGYRLLWRVDGRSWNCRSRPRTDKHPTEDKVALGWGDWSGVETAS
jgi:hypothetical protein